jgi:hypothetical protein
MSKKTLTKGKKKLKRLLCLRVEIVNIDKGENLGVRGWEVVGGTSRVKDMENTVHKDKGRHHVRRSWWNR